MAPIPSTLEAGIQAQVEAAERRRTDLQDIQIPRLRKCEGPLSTQQQYAAELREDIETFARQIESLDIAVEDQKGERNRRELRRIVNELQEALASFRRDSRAALLASKRAIDAKRSSNRDELLRSNVVREKQDLNEKVAEDALMTTSNNITEALQRTIVLMRGELETSVLTTQLFDASTASLKSASSTHDVLDGLLSTSKHLITALEKSDWVDRLLILAALVFFVLVVLFILKQRLVDRSLRIAFWWTRFIPSFSSAEDQLVNALEKGSLAITSTELASTILAAISATATAAVSSITTSPAIETVLSTPTPALEPSDASSLFDPDHSSGLAEPNETSVISDEDQTLSTSLVASSLPSSSESSDEPPDATPHLQRDEL